MTLRAADVRVSAEITRCNMTLKAIDSLRFSENFEPEGEFEYLTGNALFTAGLLKDLLERELLSRCQLQNLQKVFVSYWVTTWDPNSKVSSCWKKGAQGAKVYMAVRTWGNYFVAWGEEIKYGEIGRYTPTSFWLASGHRLR